MFFALFVLYATRDARTSPATLGIVLGARRSARCRLVRDRRIARPDRRRPDVLVGCFLFPAPLVLVPAAGGPYWFVLGLLFVSEFLSGVGLMLLDIMAGSIMAGHVPDRATLARLWCLHGRELRRAPAGRRSAGSLAR